MKTYIERLKAFSEGEAAKKAGTSQIVSKNNSRINNDWRPIEEQITMLMRSLPENINPDHILGVHQSKRVAKV